MAWGPPCSARSRRRVARGSLGAALRRRPRASRSPAGRGVRRGPSPPLPGGVVGRRTPGCRFGKAFAPAEAEAGEVGLSQALAPVGREQAWRPGVALEVADAADSLGPLCVLPPAARGPAAPP